MSALAIVANIIVPGAGLAIHYLPQIATFLAGINGRCDQLSQNQAHFRRVSDRLHEILMQLSTMEAKGQLPSPQVVKRFTELLEDFDAYLTKYLHANFLTRLLTQDDVAHKITVFHNEVDGLLRLLDLAHIAQMTDWRLQYDADARAETAKWTQVLTTNRLLVEHCTDAAQQREAMLRLLHELHQGKPPTLQTRLVKQAFQTLSRLSGLPPVDVPPWFVAPEDVAIPGLPIARGSSSAVYLGHWRRHTRVVVKVFVTTDVERELHVWAKLRHPNVVQLFGGCHIGTHPFALAAEAERGSFDQYLLHRGGSRAMNATGGYGDDKQLAALIMDAAIGLEYVHAMGIVHGDVKCNNFVVTSAHRVQLCDFGCAFAAGSDDVAPTTSALRWTAPECLAGGTPSKASDIYALGMTIVEATTLSIPFRDVPDDCEVRERVVRGELPSMDTESPWAVLVQRLCAPVPDERLDLKSFIEECHNMIDVPEGAPATAPATVVPNCPSAEPVAATGAVPAAEARPLREYGYGLVAEKSVAETKSKKAAPSRRLSTRRLSVSDVDTVVASQDIQALLQWLQRPTTSDAIKEKLLQALMPVDPATIATHGGLEVLLALVSKGSTPTLKEVAATLLGQVARCSAGLAASLRSQGAVQLLIKLLRGGTYSQHACALRALAQLTFADDESVRLFLDDAGSLEAVVSLLRTGSNRQREVALCLVANVAVSPVASSIVTALAPLLRVVDDMTYEEQRHVFRLIVNVADGAEASSLRAMSSSLVSVVVTQCRLQHKSLAMASLVVQSAGLLAFTDDAFALALVDAGAVPLLWNLYHKWSSLRCYVLETMANLATTGRSRRLLGRNHGIDTILAAMRDASLVSSALHLLHNLALEPTHVSSMLSLGVVEGVMEAIVGRPDVSSIGTALLALLSTADDGVDRFATAGAVAWMVTELRRLPSPGETEVLWRGLRNLVVALPCRDAFVLTGGIPLLLKRFGKATGAGAGPMLGLLANVATSLELVLQVAQHEATLYSLMQVAGSGVGRDVELEALRCVANITFFEPSVLRVVKTSGLAILLPLLTPSRRSSPHQALALRIVAHMSFCEGFRELLVGEAVAVVRDLAQNPALTPTCDAILSRLAVPARTAHKASLLRTISKVWRRHRSNQQDAEIGGEDLVALVRALQEGKDVLGRLQETVTSEAAADTCIDAGIVVPLARRLRHKGDCGQALRVVRQLLDHCSERCQCYVAVDGLMKPLVAIATQHERPEDRDDAIQVVLALATIGQVQAQVLDRILGPTPRGSICKGLLWHEA
ncbi:protein kinase [Achlya hypogyna]|uniref:Protein kinase n=1 Tax=Achlya hypogyna TaxID=1202772 RepID=A0A1V9YRU8_ACHHY|nr:protein kinase [Achlya hypogyna]